MKKIVLSALALTLTALSSLGARPEDVKKYTDYLYTIMLPSDSLDFSREFYERNVALALDAREQMLWGKIVSENDFRDFVLPLRVNNENLDEARAYIFSELAPKIKNMSMTDAALAINHWLHEKVTYRPSDARTSSPLATIKTSFGRCGEESTLGVAAMRALGIPARQVYTPRWAHTDDNHAWVEVWTDGKWHFLGACEPEAILDLGWFNAPASRGMLFFTNAPRGYSGSEETLSRSSATTKINVTHHYTATDTARVKVVDTAGRPVGNARVNFMLYNYAEFYPIAVKQSDAEGRAKLATGLGDLVIWAVSPDGKHFGFNRYTTGKDGVLTLVLDKDSKWTGEVDFNLVPPSQAKIITKATDEQNRLNDKLKAREDSIRNAYMATFFTAESAKKYAAEKGWPAEAAELLPLSYGNHAVITEFLNSAKNKKLAVEFLNSLSEKDLRDIQPEILRGFYTEIIPAGADTARYVSNVMCPRVDYEPLTLYRDYFTKNIPAKQRAAYKADPSKWIAWIAANIVADDSQPANIYLSPAKVYEHRRDVHPYSLDVFAVASLRSFGVEAWIDPVTGRPRYTDPKSCETRDIILDKNSDSQKNHPQGNLRLAFEKTGHLEDPVYYSHFTLSGIKDGSPMLYSFPQSPVSETFAKGQEVEAGQTLLVSGQRLADGSVLAHASVFMIPENGEVTHPLVVRQDNNAVQVIGNFNSENIYHDMATDTDKSLLSTTGRGYYILAMIRPNHEPSSHLLNDMSASSKALEESGEKIMLLFANAEEAAAFNRSAFPNLPSNVVFGYDVDGQNAAGLEEFGTDKPVIIIADTFNRVVFASQGYSIATDQRLLETLKKLR